MKFKRHYKSADFNAMPQGSSRKRMGVGRGATAPYHRLEIIRANLKIFGQT